MAYTAITSSEIAVDRPITNELMTKFKDNFDYLFSQSGASDITLPNPSFEIDEDADGIPDSWTRTLYAAGAGALSTADPMHGEKAFVFTRTSGAGNGGGELLSDYLTVTTGLTYYTGFAIKQSSANVRSKVRMQFYTAAKTTLADSTIYDSTANPTVWQSYTLSYVPPATARFAKILLIGGTTDHDFAGTVAFDDIQFGRALYNLMSSAAGTEIYYARAETFRASSSTSMTKIKSTEQLKRAGAVTISFEVSKDTTAYANYVVQVYRNGSAVSTAYSSAMGNVQWSTAGSIGDFTTVSISTIACNVGDYIEVYGRTPTGFNKLYVKNLYVRTQDPDVVRELAGF